MKVGNGDIIYALGSTEMEIDVGNAKLIQRFLVLETNAFDCILGLDFMQNPEINGLLMRPPRLIVNKREVLLYEDQISSCIKLLLFRTENYKMLPNVRMDVLKELGINPLNICIDLFASHDNKQEKLYCTKTNSAWSYDWGKLTSKVDEYLWANHPFTKLLLVLTKVAIDEARLVLVTPDWGDTGDVGKWRRILDRLTIDRVEVQMEIPIYKKDKGISQCLHHHGLH